MSNPDERLTILTMVEHQQITAEQAAHLLDALDATEQVATTLPDATVEEEAWMLTALLQVTEAISTPSVGQDSLEDMLARIVRVVPLLAGVDHCTVLLWDATRNDYVPAAWYPASDDAPQIAGAVRDQLLRSNGEPLLLNDGAASCVFLPMTTQGRILGIMRVEYAGRVRTLTGKETAILANIASQAAVGVENMRLRQEAVERARLERELQLAHSVQTSLLPSLSPNLPGWQIASHWQAARTVGGDFYDFVPLERGRLGLVIADVSDKGMSAALFMALSRSIVRASAARSSSAARALERANRLICDDAHDGMFVTLFYAILDPQNNTLAYANAGHNPPVLISQAGVTPLEGRGIALGVVGSVMLEERIIPIQQGDIVMMYTDGLTEAINDQEEQFGLDRLVTIVQQNRHLPPSGIIEQILLAVTSFTGAHSMLDDMTVVVAKHL